jgi:hypothetical protein
MNFQGSAKLVAFGSNAKRSIVLTWTGMLQKIEIQRTASNLHVNILSLRRNG